MGPRPHFFRLSWIWFISCLGGFGHIVSKSSWLHLGACSGSPLHTWFLVVASWLRHTIIEVIHKHPCIETMVWTCTDGLHKPLSTLIKLLIIVGRVSVDLPLQTVGLGCTEKFLQKFSLKFDPISNCPRPQ